MDSSKNKRSQLYAIYRHEIHIGNVREVSKIQAIELYLLDSGYSKEDLLDTGLTSKYKAIIAKENIHYL